MMAKDRSRRPSWEERRIDELKLNASISEAPPTPNDNQFTGF